MKKIVLLIAIPVLLTQCRPARMGLEPNGWENKETYVVSGKKGIFSKEKLNFGQYYSTSVKRSWVKGNTSRFGLGKGNLTGNDYTNLISMDYIKRKQTIQFSLADQENNHSEVYCVSRFNSKDLTIGSRPENIVNLAIDIFGMAIGVTESTYYVQLYTAENVRPWEMIIDNIKTESKPKTYKGYLSFSKDKYYSIHPVYKMENKDGNPVNILFGSVGYEFRDKTGKPVAAVSLLNKGVIYLQPLPSAEKFLLANACAALLMQEMIG
jgi:hypothetical protein